MTSLDDNVREFQYNQFMKPSRDSLGKVAWVRKDFLSQGKIQIYLSGVQEKSVPLDHWLSSLGNPRGIE